MLTLSDIQTSALLDTTLTPHSDPLLQIRHALHQLQKGEVLQAWMNCQSGVDDLQAWCQQTGYEILRIDKQAENKCAYYVQKGSPMAVQATLNTGRQPCPAPVIEAARALSHLAEGDILKMYSACPSALDDVNTWANNTQHQIRAVHNNSHGDYVFYIQKKGGTVLQAA